MPLRTSSAYRDGSLPRTAMLAAAAVGVSLPAMSILHRELTEHGVTVVVAPGRGPVTVEAWIGGGTGDEGRGEGGLAHLAEHVALARAEDGAGARLRRVGGGLDGWVTPDATVFRAVAPRGALIEAIEAVAAAGDPVGPGVGRDSIAVEKARIAAEGRTVHDGDGATIAGWWWRSYDPRRTTIAVRGGDARRAVHAVARSWRRAAGPRARFDHGHGRPPASPLTMPALDGGWAVVADIVDAGRAELAALAMVAAGVRMRSPWNGLGWADVVASRGRALWIATGRGDGPDTGAVRRGLLVAAMELDDAELAWVRAATRLPLAGVAGVAGELAAGQHLHGDPRWAARWRAEIRAVDRDLMAEAVREMRPSTRPSVLSEDREAVESKGQDDRGVGTRTPVSARRAPRPVLRPPPPALRPLSPGLRPPPPALRPPPPALRPPPPVSRATMPSGTRVIAVRVPGATRVAVRVAWAGGFAAEDADERGVVALVAAAAPSTCGTIDAAAETAALGGELAGVAGRWSAGLRSRWPVAAWRDGLAVVAACARTPSFDAAVVMRERDRLAELARDVAGSASRRATLTYLATRWGNDPLGRDALAAPDQLAALTRSVARTWWRDHHALSSAVVVVAGDVDPDDAIAAVTEAFAASGEESARRRAALAGARPPPPLPDVRQVFADGPDGHAALVIGLPGLAAADADRGALDGLAAILADPGGRLHRTVAAAGARVSRVAVVDGPAAGYVAISIDGSPPIAPALAAAESMVRELGIAGPSPAEVAVAQASLAPADDDVLSRADVLARAELAGAPAMSPPLLDAATLQRVAAAVLRWDDAVVATVRPPDMTPGARARAVKRVPKHRLPRPRRGGHR